MNVVAADLSLYELLTVEDMQMTYMIHLILRVHLLFLSEQNVWYVINAIQHYQLAS